MPMLNWQLCACIIRWSRKHRCVYLSSDAIVRNSNLTFIDLTTAKPLCRPTVQCLNGATTLIVTTTTHLQGLFGALSRSFSCTVHRTQRTYAFDCSVARAYQNSTWFVIMTTIESSATIALVLATRGRESSYLLRTLEKTNSIRYHMLSNKKPNHNYKQMKASSSVYCKSVLHSMWYVIDWVRE